MAKQIGDVTIECVKGDITKQDGFDAVVNAANAELRTGGGVAGAIHRAAGPDLEKECRPLAPITPGQAVITSGQKMMNPNIIHCLGPVYGVDKPSDKLLADCYRNALSLADEKGLTSVAFPALSTGVFGYPMDSAAEVAMKAVVEEAPNLKSVRQIRFVLISDDAVTIHEQALEKAAG